jgi:hypothetical protein
MRKRLALLGMLAVLLGCRLPFSNNLPPAEEIMHPGPGVDGPGPGVMMLGEPGLPDPSYAPSSQIYFVGPEGMYVSWDVGGANLFDSEPLICPGRYNFPQGAIYRLKLTEIPGRAGIELYPTLEVAPTTPRTEAYLAHNAVPIQFTEEDLDQVLSGNFVTKVIYLPDAEFQELALAGVETLVSTRLDPGMDPIVEADRRGAILAIVRMGNKDLEIPGGEELVGNAIPACYVEGGGPPPFLAGVTAPQYGLTMSGTPIGLPGPPHVPHGIPAGLQKHVMRNHTRYRIPDPVEKVKVHVKQTPGFQYPRPARRTFIHERVRAPWIIFRKPFASKHQPIGTEPDPDCEECE